MIKCQKCGNELPENSKFCKFCGEKVLESFEDNVTCCETGVKKKKNTKTTILIIVSLLILIAVGLAIFFLIKNSKNDDSVAQESKTTAITEESKEKVTDVNNEIVVEDNRLLLVKAFSSGNFYYKITGEIGEGIVMTTSVGLNGENFYFGMSYPDLLDIGILEKDGQVYAIDYINKNYAKTTYEKAGIDKQEMLPFSSAFVDEAYKKYIKTTEVKIDGKVYICEEYDDCIYYFDKITEKLVKNVSKNTDENNGMSGPSEIIFDEFVTNPDDSYFSIPLGYTEISDDELMEQMPEYF